ncbi:hypothetical protein [Deinococcus sedimenti]|uniref:Uncharacterized protein n=1 Tax=Deinococcus sedimenti TaxID=1867090 RepID=A0ABQ2SC16_9DEIO|nr:hypothetical protein [Deinococcus sedimenti]GGS10333.1 hypothetical protein GCM10008960_40590 [Deinococcus sedimenti]
MTSPLPPDRSTYLRRCMLLSMKRRVPALLTALLVPLAGALALSVSLPAALGVALAALLITASVIAVQSYQRHADDPLPPRVP